MPPSSEDSDMSPWEALLTNCLVKDLHPGYIVVRLNGDSFETLSADNEADMYVVMSVSPFLLKDLKTDTTVCIRYNILYTMIV